MHKALLYGPVHAGAGSCVCVCARVWRHGEAMQRNGRQSWTAAFCQISSCARPEGRVGERSRAIAFTSVNMTLGAELAERRNWVLNSDAPGVYGANGEIAATKD